ncbi:MAG: HAD family phosphatase [Planctomycetales bacterium]|nr:HAD family phosphatase [Planctomycetales bacterium]
MRAVAFDLDGLMFNTEGIYVQVAELLLESRGRTLDMQLIAQMMGRPARIAIPMLIDHYGLTDSVEQIAQETRTLFMELLPERLQPMPGLLELLEALDRNRWLKAITTSSGRAYVERVLELAKLPTTFDFLLTAEDVINGKPDPEIYLTAASRFGVAPTELVVLEDSEIGCRAAVAARTQAVAIPGPHNANAQYPNVALRVESLADECLHQYLGVAVA